MESEPLQADSHPFVVVQILHGVDVMALSGARGLKHVRPSLHIVLSTWCAYTYQQASLLGTLLGPRLSFRTIWNVSIRGELHMRAPPLIANPQAGAP